MPKENKKHLTLEKREVIEEGVRSNKSARHIASMIDVSPSTITHEVKANRIIRQPKRRRGANIATRCAKYSECQRSKTACSSCTTRLTACKHCKTHICIDSCPDFELKMCPETSKWPYVCPPDCIKSKTCNYPKCRYSATDADVAYRERLSSTREGIDITSKELNDMIKLITPLVKQGQSFEAIWATHRDELPCGVRTAYAYQAKGILGLPDLTLPRKVRIKKRKSTKNYSRERIDRTGHTYSDFDQLPLEDKVRVVQCDSVEGFSYNTHDILTMHIVSRKFQIYLYKETKNSSATVKWLDALECSLGSPDAFESIFGILLCDRGIEFDDWQQMERSCLESNKRRCKVFYCDAMNSNQKSQAERNHEQLRRILPKGHSDFDKLSVYDVATCCSHVNSYPTDTSQGKCGFELLADFIPKNVLEEIGIKQIHADKVILKPSLMHEATRY